MAKRRKSKPHRRAPPQVRDFVQPQRRGKSAKAFAIIVFVKPRRLKA